MPAGEIQLVLFDLGGVLVRLGGVDAMKELAGIDTDEEVWERWLACQWVRSFERGTCEPGEFALGVVSDWGLSVSPQDFLAQFSAWPKALFDGAQELVTMVRSRVRVGCLSNTNAIHWEMQRTGFGLEQLFDVRFLSHEIGLVKPDREIFEHVAAVAGCPRDQVVFLDDNLLNVDQARRFGFQAYAVRGVDEARDALIALQVLERSPR